jgi:hypothetical protein
MYPVVQHARLERAVVARAAQGGAAHNVVRVVGLRVVLNDVGAQLRRLEGVDGGLGCRVHRRVRDVDVDDVVQ